MSRLSRIVRNLLRVVPDPPKPIPRATASFAGLKVGQLIVNELDRRIFEVTNTDSLGADLTYYGKLPDSIEHSREQRRLEDRNWRASWSRVRVPRKRKGDS